MVSCGLGEDGSFDVEFASRFDATVVIVDPTPRAVEHFRAIETRLGRPAETGYAPGGTQLVSSYDLSSVRPGQLRIVEAAIGSEAGLVRFYEPPNPHHVSYSLVNFQNQYSTSTPFIEVDCVRMDWVLGQVGGRRPDVVKLDVEGVAARVIEDMLGQAIAPPQICVEFDELQLESASAWHSFEQCHNNLIVHEYRLAHYDGLVGFLYVRPEVYEVAARD